MTTSVPAVWYYATGTFSLLCLLFGLLLNGLVIFVFLRNKNLRRPRNLFLINLAVTDLGILTTNNSMHIIASFRKQWLFGQIGCNFYAVCGGICGLTSIATMAAISLTRLAVVIDPFSSLKLTGRFTLKCIVCSWIYGSVLAVPPLFGWNRFILEGFATTCTFDYISKDFWNRLYIVILTVGGFLIPLCVILISYTYILVKLSERSRRLMTPPNTNDQNCHCQSRRAHVYYFHPFNSSNDEQSRVGSTRISEPSERDKLTRNIRRTEARATRTALLVCVIFCTAWGPYSLMTVLSQLGFDYLVNAYTTATLGLFTKTAACINPLIYALSSAAFRHQICVCLNFVYTRRERRRDLSLSNSDINRKNTIIKCNL